VRSPLEPGLVQVAGVADEAEAALLVESGVRYLGFPLRIPVNREDLTEAEAAAIIRRLRPPVYGVLIAYLARAEEIAGFAGALGARIVQLHGDIALDELVRLRGMAPGLTVIKSLAGGLTPANVRRAIEEVRPAGVDVHTGVEDESGRKNREKVTRFVNEARAAFRLYGPSK
jgi:phosphoribosylanthranilate isomerase